MAFPIESYAAKIQRKLLKKQRVIEAASGRSGAEKRDVCQRILQ